MSRLAARARRPGFRAVPIIRSPRDAARAVGTAIVWFGDRWRRPLPREPNRPRKREAALVLAVCAALLAIATIDGQVAARIADMPSTVVRMAAFVTTFGTSGYIFAISAAVAAFALMAAEGRAHRDERAGLAALAERAVFVVAVNAVSGLASQALKHLFGRARPNLMSLVGPYHFDAFSLAARYASFPSGHTVTAFATAAALGFMMPRLRVPLYAAAILIAASRIIVFAHYPSDVAAGMALGLGSAFALRRTFGRRRIAFRRSPRGWVVRGRGLVMPALRPSVGTAV